jgi:hypothetical protein
MDGDATSRELPTPAAEVRRLPEVQSLEAVLVRFREPVPYVEGAARKEAEAVVEFRVTTSAEFPIRAEAPALFVGDAVVTESRRVGERSYVFRAYGPVNLKPGAPISLGWIGSGPPQPQATGFAYRLLGEERR